MERLCVKYICNNSEDKNHKCDFSFNALVTFPASNILPKYHNEIAMFLLSRQSDERLQKVYEKIKENSYKKARFDEVMSQLERARLIVEEIGIENINAFCSLDIGFYCPKCHTFQMQVEIVMTWKDKFGKMQRFTLDHRCRNCDAHLVKLTGSSKQLASLSCPECGGSIKIDESSIVPVVSNTPKPSKKVNVKD